MKLSYDSEGSLEGTSICDGVVRNSRTSDVTHTQSSGDAKAFLHHFGEALVSSYRFAIGAVPVTHCSNLQ